MCFERTGSGTVYRCSYHKLRCQQRQTGADVYLKTAEKLQVKPEHCLVFEDIPMGILAGKRAGMQVCAIEDDYSIHLTAEKKALADYYITDFRQVLDHTYEDLRK